MSPLQINLRPSEDPVQIRWTRPIHVRLECRADDAIMVYRTPQPPVWVFDRAEWTVLVTSGLVHALGDPHGWQDWDEAIEPRAIGVDERDLLLLVAVLFLRGMIPGQACSSQPQPAWWPSTPTTRACRAMERLAERALQYQRDDENEEIAADVLPWPRVITSYVGRLLPDPSFQAPLLESVVEETHVDTLVDLAKHGEEATFKELALTLGVTADQVDELWTGTRLRLRKIE